MKLKEGSFITSIVLFPFVLILCILKINNFLKNGLYSYLTLIVGIIFIVAFIFSMFFALDEIINSNNKKRLIFLILLPVIYLPIYYTKYVYKNEKFFGVVASFLNIILAFGLFTSIKGFVNDYMINLTKKNLILKDTYSYVDKNDGFAIKVNNKYVCSQKLGDYAISCDNNLNDSFMGIYNYKKKNYSEGELDDIKDYHIEQIIDTIKEKNYDYKIEKINDFTRISYNDMVVLVKQVIYQNKKNNYCLVVVQETPLLNENVFDFEESINNIEFLV